MQAFFKALLAASVASTAFSTPVPERVESNINSAHQDGIVVRQVALARLPKTGPQRLAAVYRKYNIKMPSAVAAAAAKADATERLLGRVTSTDTLSKRVNSVTATPESYDSEYLCPVYIGSNSQLLYLNFDTGSADLWTFSSLQAASQSGQHEIYTPTASKTSKRINGATFNVQYGDGSGARGVVYQDTVSVAGVSLTAQAVEAAQSVSVQFQQDLNADGLLGLGFSSLNTVQPTKQLTYFDTAIAQGKLQSPLFTANLRKGVAGSYTFGSIDSTQYTGAITYTPADNSSGYWGFSPSGYQIGSKAFTATSLTGIADTGTTLLLLPNTVASQYWSSVPNAGYNSTYGAYTFQCSQVNLLPSFTVGVGAGRYTLPGSYLNYGPVDQTTCYGGLQSSDGFGMNIYGDIFLKGVFVVFDKNGPRLGFANKNLP